MTKTTTAAYYPRGRPVPSKQVSRYVKRKLWTILKDKELESVSFDDDCKMNLNSTRDSEGADFMNMTMNEQDQRETRVSESFDCLSSHEEEEEDLVSIVSEVVVVVEKED